MFKVIGLELPSFNLPLGFLDEFLEDVEDGVQSILRTVDEFNNLINLDGKLFERFKDALEPLSKELPAFLTDILSCDSAADCTAFITDELGLDALFDVKPIPTMVVKGVNYTFPEATFNLIQDLATGGDNISEAFEVMLDKGIKCKEYRTINANFADVLKRTLDVNITETLGIPDCPSSFKVCIDLELPGIDDFISEATTILSSAGSGRRLLDSYCSRVGGFKPSIRTPLTLSKQKLYKLISTILGWTTDGTSADEFTRKAFRASWEHGPLEKDRKRLPFQFGRVWTHEEIVLWDLDIENIFGLAVGCKDDRLAAKVVIGPLQKPRYTFWSDYLMTAQGEKSLVVPQGLAALREFKKDIDSDSRKVAKIADTVCMLDFIEATDKVMKDFKWELYFNDAEISAYNVKFQGAFKMMSKRRDLGSRTKYASDLARQRLRDVEIFKVRLEKWYKLNIDHRSEMQLRYLKDPEKIGAPPAKRFLKEGTGEFLKAFPEGKKCSGPRTFYEPLTALKDFQQLFTKGTADNGNEKLFDWLLKMKVTTSGFDRLLGGKVTFSLLRDPLLGNYKKKSPRAIPFRTNLREPFWLLETEEEVAKEFEDAFGIRNVWQIFMTLYELIGRDTVGAVDYGDRRAQNLVSALERSDDADLVKANKNAFVNRWGLEVRLSYIEVTFNILDTETTKNPTEDTVCDEGGKFCVSLGLLPAATD